MNWSGWPRHRVLRGVVAVVAATTWPALLWAGVDYDPASKDWNGLASLVDTAARADVVVSVQTELNWSTLTEEEVLLLLSPGKPPSGADRQQLLRFLQAGGRVIVADDFRSGNEWLQGLGLALGEGPVPEPAVQPPPGWQGNSAWPQVDVLDRSSAPRPSWLKETARYAPTEFLAHNLQQPLVLNHPASVYPTGPRGQLAVLWGLFGPGWTVADGGGWLAEVGLEGGRLLVLADPSLLVNAMLGRFHDNRQFAANLLRYYCVQERPCTVRAVSGDVHTSGEFTPARSQRTPGFAPVWSSWPTGCWPCPTWPKAPWWSRPCCWFCSLRWDCRSGCGPGWVRRSCRRRCVHLATPVCGLKPLPAGSKPWMPTTANQRACWPHIWPAGWNAWIACLRPLRTANAVR